jgi:hypothetical protein
LISNFKILVKNLGRDRFREFKQLFDEKIIVGDLTFVSNYAKNAIFANWMEILQQIYQPDMQMSQVNQILDFALKNLFDQ